MKARVWLAGLLSGRRCRRLLWRRAEIAVVNLEQAILQTDVAQQRLQEFEENEDFASDKVAVRYVARRAGSAGQGFSA